MRAKINCKCGCTYRTEIDSEVLASYPPRLSETASKSCPDCGFLYRKEEVQIESPERRIDMLNDPYFKEHFFLTVGMVGLWLI